MNDLGLDIRCQRCGTSMDLKDPAAGGTWTPDQFWVCPKCGRHFWSTYPPPKPKTAAAPAPAATTAQAPAVTPAVAAAAKATPAAASATPPGGQAS